MEKIFKLSWPVMLGMILQNLLVTVDMFFVGKLGTVELAGVGLANSALTVIFVFSTLISAGAIALVARKYGEGDMEEVRHISGAGVTMSLALGLLVGGLALFFAKPFIHTVFRPDEATFSTTYAFVSIAFIGTVVVFLNSTIKTIVQATGDTKTPLYIFGFANIVNMILDPVLIFGLKMGVQGAACSTLIANIIALILTTRLLVHKLYGGSVHNLVQCMRPSVDIIKKTIKVGGWACVQQSARPITGMLMVSLVYAVGGAPASAAFGIGSQVINYTFIFLSGISMAVAIMVGQSLGRGEVDECDDIIRQGMKFGIVNMLAFALLYLVFPGWLMGVFSNDPEVITIGISYLRIVYLGIMFVLVPDILGGAFRGAGDTYPLMVASMSANVAFKLPMAFVLARIVGLGTNGVWWAIAISVMIEAVIVGTYFAKGKWKEIEL